MAEAFAGVGVAANVLQLVTAGYRLLERINRFQSKRKDMPASFRELSIQLPLMIDTCENISKENHAIDTSSFREVVNGCFEHVQSLDTLLSEVLPTDKDSPVARTWKAIGSVRIEKKIVEYQRILEIYKTALILHVGRRNSHVPLSQEQSFVPAGVALSLQRDTCYSYPSFQISRFIGRECILGKVDDALLTPEANSRRPKVAILLGMGGQGKTALALEYCRRAQSCAYFKSILWVDAASSATVAQSFENLADHLTKRQRSFKDFNACLEFVKDTIEMWAAPWMVVFDNFDQPGNIPNIMDYVPYAYNGAVLVTSRHADSGALGPVLEMGSMGEDESTELLLHRTHDLPSFQNVEGARLVVRALGCLPLAIEQAGAYFRARKISFPAFLDHFNYRRAKVLQHTPDLWDYRKKVDDEKNTTSLSVFTTWELSFQQLAQNDEQKASLGHFMTLLGFLHNLEIREGLFKAYFHRSNPAPPWMKIFITGNHWDTYNYEDTVVTLSQLSLLQYTRAGDHSGCQISLHPLIRDWTQYRLKPEDRRAYTMEAMLVTRRYIAQNEAEIGKGSLQNTREVLTHTDVCVENYSRFCLAQSQSLSEELRECLTAFGLFYTRHGRYQHGEDILNDVIRKDEVQFGPNHVKTLETKLYITDVYLGLGRYHDVEELIQEIKPKLKKLPNAARAHIFCNLAKAAFKQGQYQQALDLFKSALQIQEQFLTLGHPDLLKTYEALAQVYRNQGRNGKAIDLYSKTMDSYIKLHGKNHPDTFSTMNNLGNCYRNLAKFDQANKIYHDALCGNENFLGVDHPNTLNNMVNLAINHRYRYQYEEAEELFTRALATYQTKLGPEHPETLRTNLNLASLYLARGYFEKACSMLTQVFEGRLKRLGVHSDYTLYAIERLLSALNGQCKEADTYATQMLKMQGDLGLANTYSGAELAILKQDFRFTAVEIIFTRTLARRKSNLVWNHNDITDLSRILAFVYSAQNRHKMTEDTLLQIIHAHETRCGLQHEETLRAELDLSTFREKGTFRIGVEKASGSSNPKLDTPFESQQESQASIIDSSEQNRNIDFIQASMSTLGLP